jgi:hypothetical protein
MEGPGNPPLLVRAMKFEAYNLEGTNFQVPAALGKI